MTGALNPADYQHELTLLHLAVASDDPRYGSLVQLLEPETLSGLLAQQATDAPTMDWRTQAAYLVNGFSWQWCCLLAWLDLRGLSPVLLFTEQLQVYHRLEQGVHEGKPYSYLRYQWHLPELQALAEAQPAAALGSAIKTCLAPLLAAVKQQTGLSVGALWRLVNDSLTFAYLFVGQQLQCEQAAMARAQAIVEAAGKPLANRQWRYQYCTAERSGEAAIGNWYRLRGGCCRYYTLPEGEYCATCVHLPDEERMRRINAQLIASAE